MDEPNPFAQEEEPGDIASVAYRYVFVLFASISQEDMSTPNFLCMLPVVVAWSTSDDSAICYVLPVLWTMQFFLVIGPVSSTNV